MTDHDETDSRITSLDTEVDTLRRLLGRVILACQCGEAHQAFARFVTERPLSNDTTTEAKTP